MLYKASYKAPHPRPDQVWIGYDQRNGELIYGEYDSVMEVFVSYFASLRHKDRAGAPHLEFAHCGDDLDSIFEFTKRWGPLMPTPSDMEELRRLFPTEEGAGEQYFAFYASDWRAMQKQFKKELALLARRESSPKRELALLWPHTTTSTFKTGGIYVGVDVGYSLEDLTNWWACTPAQASRWAKDIGVFVTEDRKTAPLQVRLMATTLWDAFWLMLAYDLTTQKLSVGVCENEKCGREYVIDRNNKRYCSVECAQRKASLTYYHRKGKRRRAMDHRSKNV